MKQGLLVTLALIVVHFIQGNIYRPRLHPSLVHMHIQMGGAPVPEYPFVFSSEVMFVRQCIGSNIRVKYERDKFI